MAHLTPRNWFFLVLIALLGVMPVRAQDITGDAAFAYAEGDYELAIAAYQVAIANGQTNGALYFNLGHAHYAAGNLGEAMLNYRRAAMYLPRDADVQLNIARLRAEDPAIIREETNPLYLLANLARDTLSLREYSQLTLGLWMVFFLSLVAVVASRGATNARIISGALAMMLMVAGIVLAVQLYVHYQRPAAVVTVNQVPVMTGPGADYQQIDTLLQTAELRVIARQGAWVRFVLPDGRQGWLSRDSLGYIDPNLG
jgi:tetratricopeptide (TPR) repeat protein